MVDGGEGELSWRVHRRMMTQPNRHRRLSAKNLSASDQAVAKWPHCIHHLRLIVTVMPQQCSRLPKTAPV